MKGERPDSWLVPSPVRPALLDHLERTAGVGGWVWTPDTDEVLWSGNVFRLFGLAPRPSPISLAFVRDRVHPADATRFDAAFAAWAEGEDRAPLEFRIRCEDDVVRDLRADVVPAESAAGCQQLTGSVRDVTALRRSARVLDARAAVSDALDRWVSGACGAQRLLSGFGGALDLPFGVLWATDRAVLTPKWIWQASTSMVDLAAATDAWRPDRATPTLGTAWACSRAVSSNDPAAGAPPARAAAMQHAGIRAAIAVPAVAVDEPLAVVEFLSLDPIEPTDPLLAALQGIGQEIGHFLDHRRGELATAVLTPREAEVLQLAARGVSAQAIAQQMHLSPATVKRHFEDAYGRLGVRDRAAAVAVAMRHGWIT